MLAGATYGLGDIPSAWLNKLDRKVADEIRLLVRKLLEVAQRLRAA
jgi:ADP-ribosyl-[dinitrogen reductase] hydrolase